MNSIGGDPLLYPQLERFVNLVYSTITHPYSLAKYIFLREITDNDNFDVANLINWDLFAEVWLSLIAYNRCAVQNNITRGMHQRIELHIELYFQINGTSSLGLFSLKKVQSMRLPRSTILVLLMPTWNLITISDCYIS